jgi:hypothetical protein
MLIGYGRLAPSIDRTWKDYALCLSATRLNELLGHSCGMQHRINFSHIRTACDAETQGRQTNVEPTPMKINVCKRVGVALS